MDKNKTDNAILIVIGLCFAFLCYAHYTATDSSTRVQIVTAVIATLSLVTGYRWGSSQSSTKKDETIRQMQEDSSTTVVKANNIKTENIELATADTINESSKG